MHKVIHKGPENKKGITYGITQSWEMSLPAVVILKIYYRCALLKYIFNFGSRHSFQILKIKLIAEIKTNRGLKFILKSELKHYIKVYNLLVWNLRFEALQL